MGRMQSNTVHFSCLAGICKWWTYFNAMSTKRAAKESILITAEGKVSQSAVISKLSWDHLASFLLEQYPNMVIPRVPVII